MLEAGAWCHVWNNRQAALWMLAEHGRGMLRLRRTGEAMGGIARRTS